MTENIPPQKRGRELLSEEVVLGVFRVNEVFSQALDSVFEPFKVTRQQFNVLRILYVRDEPLTNAQIAQLLMNRVPDVPRLLERLFKLGYLKRSKDQSDRRKRFSSLTHQGERLVEEIDVDLLAQLAQLTSSLSAPEQKECMGFLRRLLEPLK